MTHNESITNMSVWFARRYPGATVQFDVLTALHSNPFTVHVENVGLFWVRIDSKNDRGFVFIPAGQDVTP